MIITYPSYAAPVFLQLEGELSHGWKCVDLELNIPYFFLDYELSGAEEACRTRKIISSERDLLEFCQSLREIPRAKIFQLSIIAPNWLNQTNSWKMIDIVEIQSAIFPASEIPINIFINPIGQKLTTSMHEISLQDATQVDSIFSFQ